MSKTLKSLFLVQQLAVSVGDPVCKINISGYALNNFKILNPEGYTIMCETGKYCDAVSFFPGTNTIVLKANQQSHLFYTDFRTQFIPDLAEELGVSQEVALQKSFEFFSDKKVVVQPKGLQGKVYNIMRNIQNYLPMAYTTEAVSILKTTGMTGVEVITQAPLTFVGATYIGGLFFGYCGSVAGNNPVGTIFNATSYLLTRPMRGVEITLNGLILGPISNLVGIPLVLNGTQEMLAGKGMTLKEYAKIGIAFERVTTTTSQKVQQTKKFITGVKKAFEDATKTP